MRPLPQRDSEADGLQEAHRRLAALYEISQLLTCVRNVEETLGAVIDVVVKTLSLIGVVAVLDAPGTPRVIAWAANNGNTSRARSRALDSYAYLVGSAGAGPARRKRGNGLTDAIRDQASHFIALPLVVEAKRPFGVFQVEAVALQSEQDLVFVNAVVNQVAIAFEWHKAIASKQATAHAAKLKAEDGQAAAEILRERSQVLAKEDARLLQVALQASQSRENLLGVVSHDLRNQLNAIFMSVALLLRKRPTGDQERRAHRNMVIIQHTALGMDRLIGDLLDIAGIESGQLSLDKKTEALGTLVANALQALEEQAAAQSLRLTSEVVGTTITVNCDAQRINQVFANLVGNALKFTGVGGAIAVRVQAQAGVALFVVADTGIGIPAEDLPHVFDRFWQGNRTTRAGTGLGLAIAKGIIESHGGKIWLESQAGIGTKVFFTLPLALEGAV